MGIEDKRKNVSTWATYMSLEAVENTCFILQWKMMFQYIASME